MDSATSGKVIIDGRDISKLKAKELTKYRRERQEINELILVFIIALTVFPVDWLRKYILKKKHIAIGV